MAKFANLPFRKILICLICLFLFACDCSEGDTTSAFGPDCGETQGEQGNGESGDNGGGGGNGQGTLIVSDQGEGSFRRFTDVNRAEGPQATPPPVRGSLTRMTRPQFLTMTDNQLIVCDEGTNAILFFEDPLNLDGDIPPVRVLQGLSTELNAPVQAHVDRQTDELWVLNRAGSAILVFENASSIDGELAPTRRIFGPATAISNPSCFLIDSQNDRLTVVNPNEILTFDGLREMNGAPVPIGRVSGGATQLSNTAYARFAPNGTLVVVNAGNSSLLFFEDFQFDQNNQVPTRIVQGSNTGISRPGQFVFSGGGLFLNNETEILFYDDLETLEGNPFPNRRFSAADPPSVGLRGMVIP